MPKFTAEELKDKSPEELAILAERNHPLSAEGILISDERQRRLISAPVRKKQWHEKPFGLVLLMVVAGLIVGCLIYLLGLH